MSVKPTIFIDSETLCDRIGNVCNRRYKCLRFMKTQSENAWVADYWSEFGRFCDHFIATKDKAYLAWIKNRPCMIMACKKRGPSDPHHIPLEGHGSMSGKTDDYRAVPLCRKHHSEYYSMGRKTFAKLYGIAYEVIIDAYQTTWRLYGKDESNLQ